MAGTRILYNTAVGLVVITIELIGLGMWNFYIGRLQVCLWLL